jgi:hypothetical protein
LAFYALQARRHGLFCRLDHGRLYTPGGYDLQRWRLIKVTKVETGDGAPRASRKIMPPGKPRHRKAQPRR